MTLGRLKPRNSAMLVLPGGVAWDKKKNKEAAALAVEFLAHGTPVAAICGATAGLARAGVLDTVAHTSNSKEYIAQTGYKGLPHYRDEAAVASGNLITASAMNPVDFAREIFAILDVYSGEVLKAWYNLYKTGNAKYFADLMRGADARGVTLASRADNLTSRSESVPRPGIRPRCSRQASPRPCRLRRDRCR
jgi:hypothetical protein